MKMVIFIILIGAAEFLLSWLNHKINILVLSRKAIQAAKLDLIANTIAEAIPYLIYVETKDPIYLVPRILMNTVGTFTVGKRKPDEIGMCCYHCRKCGKLCDVRESEGKEEKHP